MSGGIDVAKALGAFCQLIPDMFTASFLRRLAQHSAPTQGLRWDLSFYCHTEAGVTLRPPVPCLSLLHLPSSCLVSLPLFHGSPGLVPGAGPLSHSGPSFLQCVASFEFGVFMAAGCVLASSGYFPPLEFEFL